MLYLNEAFKKLDLLEDDFSFRDDTSVDELVSYVKDDIDAPEEEVIIDTEAYDESDIKDAYVGKAILECECCHSRIYKNIADVIIDHEMNLANTEEECPVCGKAAGFTVVGKIEAFEEVEEEPEQDEKEEEVPEISDEDIEEALKEALQENTNKDESLAESVTIDMNTNTVTSDTNEAKIDMSSGEVKLGASDETETPEDLGGELNDEMIAPLSDDDIAEIENNGDEGEPVLDGEFSDEMSLDDVDVPVEDNSDLDLEEPIDSLEAEDGIGAGGEEKPEEPEDDELEADDDEEEIPNESLKSNKDEQAVNESLVSSFDEFNEQSFNSLAESYLKRVYENVSSFITEKVNESDGTLTVEGLISFNSGAKKHTSFIFENSRISKRGAIVLEGMNETFSKNSKAFIVKGNLNEHEFVCESMIYNYQTKTLNESNESEAVRVYGRCVNKK